jgi:phenylpropionate dioxygenase-like ring-hydroxylating dioxygenase large terminal subunit
MKFVRNAWYVAGWASEFGPDLKRATILGDDVVFYRTGDGKVAALEDRCPHRLLPLSMGRVVDGNAVQCGYHGLTFDSSGKCVRAPRTGQCARLLGSCLPGAREERHCVDMDG